MERYLLDTDICVFLLQGKFGIKEKIKEVGLENCFISEITIAELTYGAYRSNHFEKHLKEVSQMEILFGIIPIYDTYPAYAKEKVRLRKEGNLIPDFDLLIGATSILHSMVMVTNNEKHLSRMEGVRIELWAKN